MLQNFCNGLYYDRETKKPQVLELPAEQFISRFLQHTLPKGFQKVRTYGLYHPKGRGKLEVVKEQLQPKESEPPTEAAITKPPATKPPVRFYCPCCKVEMVKVGKIINTRGPPP